MERDVNGFTVSRINHCLPLIYKNKMAKTLACVIIRSIFVINKTAQYEKDYPFRLVSPLFCFL